MHLKTDANCIGHKMQTIVAIILRKTFAQKDVKIQQQTDTYS
jgi:hypothetical protein